MQLRRVLLLQVELVMVAAYLAIQAKCWALEMPYSAVEKGYSPHYGFHYSFRPDLVKPLEAFQQGLAHEVDLLKVSWQYQKHFQDQQVKGEEASMVTGLPLRMVE